MQQIWIWKYSLKILIRKSICKWRSLYLMNQKVLFTFLGDFFRLILLKRQSYRINVQLQIVVPLWCFYQSWYKKSVHLLSHCVCCESLFVGKLKLKTMAKNELNCRLAYIFKYNVSVCLCVCVCMCVARRSLPIIGHYYQTLLLMKIISF